MIDVKMDCAIAVKTMVSEIWNASVNINNILVIGNKNAQVAVTKFLDREDTYEFPFEHMQQNRPGSDSQVRTTHGSDHFKVQRVQSPSTSQAFYGITVGQNPKEEPDPIGTFLLAGTESHPIKGSPSLIWRRASSGFTQRAFEVDHRGAQSLGVWLGDNIQQIAEAELHKAVGAIILLKDDIWRLSPSTKFGSAIAFTTNAASGNREDIKNMGDTNFGSARSAQGPDVDRSFSL